MNLQEARSVLQRDPKVWEAFQVFRASWESEINLLEEDYAKAASYLVKVLPVSGDLAREIRDFLGEDNV